MILEKISIKNFRCIKEETLNCDELTALVGSNGAGKSAFLRAIELFFKENASLNRGDFYNYKVDEEIIITATFKDLSEDAVNLFSKYIQEGNKLTVERIFKFDGEKVTNKYHGSLLRCPEFLVIRESLEAKDRGVAAKGHYQALIGTGGAFSDLPAWGSLQVATTNMSEWEDRHQDKCIRMRDDGQFFGFKQVASGHLGKYIKPIFIPAVRDASLDADDNSKSPISEILNLVVRSVIAKKPEIAEFKKRVIEEHRKVMSPSLIDGLPDLGGDMSDILHNFTNDSDIKLEWKDLGDVNLPLPEADMKILEDGFASDISHVGHGLQRLFILTLFQYLIKIKNDSDNKNKPEGEVVNSPDILLIIEEPEIYQHPSRQRHLANVLMKLVKGDIPGVAEKTQIIYCTHSPFFVGIDRIHQIKLLKKIDNGESPRCTKIIENNLDDVAKKIWEADGSNGSQYTKETLLPRLKTLLTPWTNEGFFSDVVVLVEGEDDVSILSGVAKKMNKDFEENGISVIPCNGKNNIDRLYLIFSGFGIPCYPVWDSDFGGTDAKPEDNKRLLKILDVAEESMEDWPESYNEKFSCFKIDLNVKLKEELSEETYLALLEKYKKQYSFSKDKHAIKNPHVISEMLNEAYLLGKTTPTFESIINNIFLLKK